MMISSINSQEAYEYVFSTAAVYSEDIFAGLYVSLIKLGLSLINSVVATATITAYVLLVAAKISVMVFPHLVSIIQKVVVFHRTKLSSIDLIFEFSVIFLAILFFILRKTFISHWKLFEKSMAQKSKATADAAPHIAFFTFGLIISIVGKKFLVHLTAPSVLPIITICIPMGTTISDLRYLASDINHERLTMLKRQNVTRRKLTLWVVLAAYHATATGLSLIPFSARISGALLIVRVMAAFVLIWVQFSHKFADIMFNATIPYLKYFSKSIPSSNFGATSGTSFISMLRTMNIINSHYEKILKSLMQEIVIVIIAIGFIFTPWRISYVGVIVISLLFPAFKSCNVLLQRDRKYEDVTIFWLEYWICWGLMWLLRCYQYNMWPSFILLSSLWLQLSVFGGASQALSLFRSNLAAVLDRHDRIQLEKEQSILIVAVESESPIIDGGVISGGGAGADVTPVIAKRIVVAVSGVGGSMEMSPMSVKKRVLKNTPITTASVVPVVTRTVASRADAINIKESKERSRMEALHNKEKLETVIKEVTFTGDVDSQRKKNKDV